MFEEIDPIDDHERSIQERKRLQESEAIALEKKRIRERLDGDFYSVFRKDEDDEHGN